MAFEFVHRQHTYRKIEPEAIVALQLWPKTGFKKKVTFLVRHVTCIKIALRWMSGKLYYSGRLPKYFLDWFNVEPVLIKIQYCFWVTWVKNYSSWVMGQIWWKKYTLINNSIMRPINSLTGIRPAHLNRWQVMDAIFSLNFRSSKNSDSITSKKICRPEPKKQIWGWNYVANSYASTARCVFTRSSWNRLNWSVTLI